MAAVRPLEKMVTNVVELVGLLNGLINGQLINFKQHGFDYDEFNKIFRCVLDDLPVHGITESDISAGDSSVQHVFPDK